VDRTDKQSVHFLVKNYRFAAAMEEIKKCIPLCANCHRILHWEERETHKRE
jgi:predicted HNH restriction endonuclease